MGSFSSEVWVKCPYFHRRDGRTFSCSGPVVKTSIKWTWPTNKDADEQEQIFCRNHYTRCEIYRCISQNRCDEDDE